MNAIGEPIEKPCLAHKKNFDTLRRVFKNGDVCLMECKLNATDEKVAVICAMQHDGNDVEAVPFAIMLNGNPYELLSPPNPEGGFHEPEVK